MRKTYVLDTNVLLHDPRAIDSFKDADVVLPFPVLEDLDKKSRFSDELGKNARFILRFITTATQKGNIFDGVSVGNGVVFSIFKDIPSEKRGFPFSIDSPKNKVLFTTYLLHKERENVVLISKDFVFRTKALSIGLVAENYRSITENYDTLYRGIRRLELPKSQIDMIYTEGYLDAKDMKFQPNEYCVLSCPENTKLTTKYNQKTKRLEPLPHLRGDIWGLSPLNEEQRCCIDLLLRDDIKLISLIGQAGTGKTLLALTCGLKKVFDEDVYKRILVSRPIMPLGKDIGYLPGTKEEKVYHWMQPIYDNLEYLCEHTAGAENGKETKDWIIDSEKIEMEAVTYIRGRSLSNTYIIIDEAQNLTPHEAKTIISRAGKGTKVILTGDPTQIDNPYLDKDSNALTYIVGKFKPYSIYGHVYLEKTERSELAAIAADIL